MPTPTESRPRIAFICGGMAPGKDGVGDYARSLAGACSRQGAQVCGIALNDPSPARVEVEEDLGIHRLGRKCSQEERYTEGARLLSEFDPDWISLQFVPYAFHPKGLPYALSGFMKRLPARARRQVMFHELWLGISRQCSAKEKVIGFLQRRITKTLITRFRPTVVHTHSQVYLRMLRELGVTASPLRLFGNIPDRNDDAPALSAELADWLHPSVRERFLLGGVFGTIHSDWDETAALTHFAAAARSLHRMPVVLYFGRSGRTREDFENLSSRWAGTLETRSLGELQFPEVSFLLKNLDLGFATTQWALIEKSGSVAAMREHGLPVLVSREDPGLPEIHIADPGLIRGVDRLLATLQEKRPISPQRGVEQVARQFLDDLASAYAARGEN